MEETRLFGVRIRSSGPLMVSIFVERGRDLLPWLERHIRSKTLFLYDGIRREEASRHRKHNRISFSNMGCHMRRSRTSLSVVIFIIYSLSTTFTSAHTAPSNYSLASASDQSSRLPSRATTNISAVSLQASSSWPTPRHLAGLDFVTPGEESVTSSEEIVEGTLLVFAPIPMGLVGETALLMQRTLAIVTGVSRYSAIVSATSSGAAGIISPNGFEWQTFTYTYSILPLRGGSASCSNLLSMASRSDGAHLPPLLTTFQDFVSGTEVTGTIEVSDEWTLLATVPRTRKEVVGTPRNFARGTTNAGLVFTTTTAHDYVPTHRCESAQSACLCANHAAGCQWFQQSENFGECRSGNGGVDCSDCPSQQRCVAPCSLLSSPCGCASSTMGCRWVDSTNQCVAAGPGGRTSCSACPSQYHCNPPQLTSIIPVSGTQLRLPAHGDIQVNFDRRVQAIHKATITFKCNRQPLPFSVPQDHVKPSRSGTGLLISVSTLLAASFTEPRTCSLIIPAGVVADESGVAFLGLQEGTYSFELGDTRAPTIVGYIPTNGKSSVDPGASVTFFFNEPIRLVSNLAHGVLFHLDPAGTGSLVGKAVADFTMSSPVVNVLDDRIVLDLHGVTKSNSLYSIELPGGAFQDAAGNPFGGLPSGAYTFRTAYSKIQGESVLSEDGGQLHTIVLIAAGVVIFVISVAMAWRVWQLNRLPALKSSSVQPTSGFEASPTLRHSVQSGGGSKEHIADEQEDDYFDQSTTFGSTTWSWTSQVEFGKQGFTKPPNSPSESQGQEGLNASGRDWAQRVRHPPQGNHAQSNWKHAFVKAATSKKGLAGAAAAAATMNATRDGKKTAPAVSPTNRPNGSQAGQSAAPKADSGAKSGHKRSSASTTPSSSDSSHTSKGKSSTASAPGGKSAADHTSHHEQKSGSSKSKTSSSAKPKPEPTKQEPPKPEGSTDFSGDSAEVKAKKALIEQKLRDMMKSPPEERKKALRELMLQYHPDKSSDPHAKEVFQFINASRAWFLAES